MLKKKRSFQPYKMANSFEWGLLFIFQMSHLMDTASFKIVVDGFNKSLPQKYKVQRIEVCILVYFLFMYNGN